MNTNTLLRSIVYMLFVIIIGCSANTPPPINEIPEDTQPIILPEDALFQKAETEYMHKRYQSAENEYTKALSIPSLQTQQRAISLLRLAHIASLRGEYATTLPYLVESATLQPDIVERPEWYLLFHQSTLFFSNDKALTAVHDVLRVAPNNKYSTDRIKIAGAYVLWTNGKFEDSIRYAQDAWSFATTSAKQAELEELLAEYLKATDKEITSILLETVTEANKGTYPYNIFYAERARQLFAENNRASSAEANAIVNYLKKNTVFVSPNILPFAKEGQKTTLTQKNTGAEIVLLLPLSSSNYKVFTQQIVNGAIVAQDMIRRVDPSVKIHYINTNGADWLNRVKALPVGTIIGGPLLPQDFEAVKKAGLLNKFIFLTFLQALPEGVEGVHAWRFYNSPQDQIDALFRFGTALGINSYGALYPGDSYSVRMLSHLRKQAPRYGARIVTTEAYGTKESLWTKHVTQYLNTKMIEKQPIPRPSFSASFIPDSFSNATILIPNFFYNGEQSQVIMGTSLWEERGSLSSYSPDTFALAVYPTPWNPSTTSEQASSLNKSLVAKSKSRANRWSGLGYDFIRYAYTMSKIAFRTNEDVNLFLSTSKGIQWSMAPIGWTNTGHCKQFLFIVTPEGNSAKLVNLKTFATKLGTAQKQQNERIRALLESTIKEN